MRKFLAVAVLVLASCAMPTQPIPPRAMVADTVGIPPGNGPVPHGEPVSRDSVPNGGGGGPQQPPPAPQPRPRP